MHSYVKSVVAGLAAAALTLFPAAPAFADGGHSQTATPIKHLVIIFQENVSFDHYFATYPNAQPNLDKSVYFTQAKPGTPTVNGLTASLLTNNPNANNTANGANAINPFRLDRSQASTCDQGHNYGPEQLAFDGGLMDMFPASTGAGESAFCAAAFAYGKDKGLVMGYFDGNTVTAMWNYAQHFAMNDNSYGTNFGPSTPGVLNLVSGTTYPATPSAPQAKIVPNNAGPGTLVGDLDPTVLRQQHILRLDVPVHYPGLVRCGQAGQHALDDVERLPGGQLPALVEQLPERAAGHVLHREIQVPAVRPLIVDGHHVRV